MNRIFAKVLLLSGFISTGLAPIAQATIFQSTGIWNNTSFGTSGGVLLSFDDTTSLITTELSGTVFGVTNPSPFSVFVADMSAATSVFWLGASIPATDVALSGSYLPDSDNLGLALTPVGVNAPIVGGSIFGNFDPLTGGELSVFLDFNPAPASLSDVEGADYAYGSITLSPLTQVPLPASALLFGSALGLAGWSSSWRRKAAC